MRAALLPFRPAEGKENLLVVMGEKGRSQLQRDMREAIAATVADTNKVRITFPQVRRARRVQHARRSLKTHSCTKKRESVLVRRRERV